MELRSRTVDIRRTRAAVGYAAAAVAAVAGLLGLVALLRGPDFVDHVTVDNQTQFDLRVVVTDGEGGGLVALTTALPNRSTRVEDVIDQGDTWVFVVTRADEHIARVRLSRHELESNGWRVVLSDALVTAAADGKPS